MSILRPPSRRIMWVMRHVCELVVVSQCWNSGLSVAVSLLAEACDTGFPKSRKNPAPNLPSGLEIPWIIEKMTKRSNWMWIWTEMNIMSGVDGYCLKCKTYGPIKDGQLIKMKNGRTRMAGTCSQAGCTGKISKIASWPFSSLHRIGLIPKYGGSIYLGLVV